MAETCNEIFEYLSGHFALYMVVVMGVLIMIINTILMLVKKPIKAFTGKIPNEKIRKLANKIFILFAFGLSTLGWFVLNKISSKYFEFEEMKILMTGAFSIVIYALGDGIVNTSQAKNLIDSVKEIAEDGKIDDDEKQHAVADFWNKGK